MLDWHGGTCYKVYKVNIRGIDEKLVAAAKAQAALERMSLTAYVIRAVEESTLVDRRPKREADKAGRVAAVPSVGVVDSGAPVVADEPVAAGPCPVCGQPTKEWGPSQKRCDRCGRNFPK